MICAAVSGGPDSMALLWFLESRHVPYFIAHVNYHHRPSASRDEAIVRQFAAEHQKTLWILHPAVHEAGNFQAQARADRYGFFVRLCRMTGADTIALGHHMDDSIETWMMQKERNAIVSHYGLQEWTDYEGLRLYRPLLAYSKAEIQQEMDRRRLPYGIDESNLQNDYRRNQIRHATIEPASASQKQAWLSEMEADNRKLEKRKKNARTRSGQGVTMDDLNREDGWLLLDQLLFAHVKHHFSRRHMEELIEQLQSGRRKEIENFWIQNVDGKICLRKKEAPPLPFYVGSLAQLQQLCEMDYVWYGMKLSTHGTRMETFSVSDDDFPLLIRPWENGDTIEMRGGRLHLRRRMISRKIPAIERDLYRVIASDQGVLFAMDTGCDVYHYVEKPLFFMVKFPLSIAFE